MNSTTLRPSIGAAAALILCSCLPSQMQGYPQEMRVEGTYTHRHLKLVFPPRIGEFERVDIAEYAPDEGNVSVGYNLDRLNVAYTVYMSRLSDKYTLEEVASGASQSIEELYEDTERVSEEDILFKDAISGKRFLFTLKHPEQGGHSYSELHLFKLSDEWWVKYRITYPIASPVEARDQIEFIIDAIEDTYDADQTGRAAAS